MHLWYFVVIIANPLSLRVLETCCSRSSINKLPLLAIFTSRKFWQFALVWLEFVNGNHLILITRQSIAICLARLTRHKINLKYIILQLLNLPLLIPQHFHLVLIVRQQRLLVRVYRSRPRSHLPIDIDERSSGVLRLGGGTANLRVLSWFILLRLFLQIFDEWNVRLNSGFLFVFARWQTAVWKATNWWHQVTRILLT